MPILQVVVPVVQNEHGIYQWDGTQGRPTSVVQVGVTNKEAA